MAFKIAIIGRPNVGKSTLFNRLAGRKLALVDDTPGVTRDRRVHPAKLYDLHFDVIDTAGFEDAGAATRCRAACAPQTEIAIREADLIFFMVDARPACCPTTAPSPRSSASPASRWCWSPTRPRPRAPQGGMLEAWELGLGEPVADFGRTRPGHAGPARRRRRGARREARLRRRRGRGRRPRRERAADRRGHRRSRRRAGLRRHQADAHRRRRPAECRQVDADQRADRRGAAADRAGGRHHPRFDLGRLGLARPRRSSCSTRPACAARPGCRRSWRSSPSPTACAPSASPRWSSWCFDATIPFEKQDLQIADLIIREGRALVLAFNKWDLIEQSAGDAGRTAREDRAAAAAGARRARRAGLGRDRPRPRQADGGGARDPQGLEQPHLHRPAQPLAGRHARPSSAARRRRPPPEDQVHDAGRRRARRASCCPARGRTTCRNPTSAI